MTYKEFEEYYKSLGVEIDETLKEEFIARKMLSDIKLTPAIILGVRGKVNGVIYMFRKEAFIRELSIKDIVGFFTFAKTELSKQYHGPCELLLDEMIELIEKNKI